jgi:hypothetical protein
MSVGRKHQQTEVSLVYPGASSPPLAPNKKTNQHGQTSGHTDCLIRMISNNFVRGFGTLNRFLLRTLGRSLQVCDKSFGGLGKTVVFGNNESSFHKLPFFDND